MAIAPNPIDTPKTSGWPRAELEETMRLWLEANQKAEATGDWGHLVPLYHDDAEYRWTVGPGEEFVARNKVEIAKFAVGEQMAGLEGWTYPYQEVLIDEQKGQVIGVWKQVSPFTRKDGSVIEVPGVGASWFRYGGDLKWIWQRDFFDLLSVFHAFAEIAAQGQLSEPLRTKLHTVGMGKLMNGHERIRDKAPLGEKLKMGAAMARVFLTGK